MLDGCNISSERKWGGILLFVIVPAFLTITVWPTTATPVPTTHNPTAFFIVSLLALVSNAGLFIYQVSVIIKKKKNPLKDELYVDTKHYKKIVTQN